MCACAFKCCLNSDGCLLKYTISFLLFFNKQISFYMETIDSPYSLLKTKNSFYTETMDLPYFILKTNNYFLYGNDIFALFHFEKKKKKKEKKR